MRPKSAAPIAPALSPGEAILCGNLAQVRYLLELGHGPNDRLDAKQAYRTPLMLCAYVTDKAWAISIANCLLEKGGLIGLKDKFGLNAMHYSCIYERDHLVELFLKAADYDLNQADRFGNTALHYASRSGNFKSGKLLIDYLVRFGMSMDKQNRKGQTPLMLAWANGNIQLADYLLEFGGVDPNIKDLRGVNGFEYERECRMKIRSGQQYDYEKLKMKQTRFDDIDAWKLRQERMEEAKRSFRFKTWSELKLEKEKSESEMPKEEDKCITPSERTNARNNPTYLFKTKPSELFETGGINTTRSSLENTKKTLQSVSFASSIKSRTMSASPSRQTPVSEDTLQRPETSLASPSVDVFDGKSIKKHWKIQIMNIFDQYTFQCSPSYCQTAASQSRLDDPSLVGGLLESPSFNEKDPNLLDSDSFVNAQKWRHGTQVMSSIAKFKNQKKIDRKSSSSPQRLNASETDQTCSLNAVFESAAAVTKFKKHSKGKH